MGNLWQVYASWPIWLSLICGQIFEPRNCVREGEVGRGGWDEECVRRDVSGVSRLDVQKHVFEPINFLVRCVAWCGVTW